MLDLHVVFVCRAATWRNLQVLDSNLINVLHEIHSPEILF
jgi:hypothetical protein